jgi:hypothetical protein
MERAPLDWHELPPEGDAQAPTVALEILYEAAETVLIAQIQRLTRAQILDSLGGRERLEWALRVARGRPA